APSDDAFSIMASAARVRRRADTSSIVLASQTVQVTTDAKASPIITAFTMMSAVRNMPHGERSRGSAAAPMTGESSCARAGPANVIVSSEAYAAHCRRPTRAQAVRCRVKGASRSGGNGFSVGGSAGRYNVTFGNAFGQHRGNAARVVGGRENHFESKALSHK